MRRYLLDTAVLASTLHNRPAPLVAQVRPWIANREGATSVLVYAEVTEYLKGLPTYP